MLVKKIVLKNFRQYIDTTIEFSTDPVKNITIVKGDNGTGKTTLAQAFQWVLYGKTAFMIKEVINRKVREKMTLGVEKPVSVTLDVIYNDVDYTITRQVIYKKVSPVKIQEADHAKFSISYIDKNGEAKYLADYEKPYFIKRMLPEELSDFFFFDGEKIEEMSKKLQLGKGSDFKEAVYSLVGLRASQNAIEHLKSKSSSKYSVIKNLQEELEQNSGSIEKLKDYNTKIDFLEKELEQAEQDKENTELNIQKLDNEIQVNNTIILAESNKMKVKEEYLQLKNEIIKLKSKRLSYIGHDLLKTFQGGIYGYVMSAVMKNPEIHRLLEISSPAQNTIPGLTKKTIEFLLKRETCLCGMCLKEDTEQYKKVEELLDYSYPKTIGMLKEEHMKMERVVEKEGKDFYKNIIRRLREVSEMDSEIEAKEIAIAEKMNMLGNTKKGEEAKKALKIAQDTKKTKEQNLVDIQVKINEYERAKKRLETEKGKLIVIDNDTLFLERCIEYATELYQRKKSDYEEKENIYRLRLQDGMNEIFGVIYDGNIFIEIDSKYRIRVTVNEEFSAEDEVERNTAQSYALIFAFIAAVIELAKKKVNEEAIEIEEKIDVEKEGYPLVMDAPLSAFDKTRIKSICTEIPEIADQVIMFIKDTDGDVAEREMAEKIGCRYTVAKVNNSNLESQAVKEG